MVREGSSAILLREIAEAPRSLVVLVVPWSGPARKTLHSLRQAADLIATGQRPLAIDFFSLREESEWTQAWLVQLGPPALSPVAYDGSWMARGAGSLIWLEYGRVVDYVPGGEYLKTPDDIVKRCQERWAQH